MARQQSLVSWIGHTDLNAWADASPEGARLLTEPRTSHALKRFKREKVDGVGPLKTAAEVGRFDVIHLMSRIPELDREFAKWLGVQVEVHKVKLDDPTDYRAVYLEADRVLHGIGGDKDLHLLLTPGTPTMAAVWVLLGKTIYQATLWQTFQGSLTQTELPFNLNLFERQVIQRMSLSWAKGEENIPSSFDEIVGQSEAITHAKRLSAVSAQYDVCVLLLGAPGTGKELFAGAIHKTSQRRHGPFEKVNCAGIPDQLLESELFGHKKGSFSGAFQDKKGRFELAHEGTLFLDEIGECSPNMQGKLLRVLQPTHDNICLREFRPVGEEKDRVADVRIIAATNRDLRAMVENGSFREDLYYRLRDMKIRLPSLRERQSDIRDIAVHALPRIRRGLRLEGGKRAIRLSEDAIRYAQGRNWVGNVRELISVLRQAAMFSEGDEIRRHDLEMAAIDVDDFADAAGEFVFGGPVPVKEYLESVRRRIFREALARSKSNLEAADLLGLTPQAVSKFIRQQKDA